MARKEGEKPRTLGVTAPISTAEPKPEDRIMTEKLEECLRSFDLFETEEEMSQRISVLRQINVLVKEWIEEVSLSKKLPPEVAETMTGKIFTFGSFRLGVHTRGADIDTLLVVPRHVERTDFFDTFAQKLKNHPLVEYVHQVEDAFVPVIKTKFDGIELDILFARLALKNIPETQDLKNVELLRNLEQKCVRSLNGCRVTDDILDLVPNHDSFKLALRAIKRWAKVRGIYSNVLGYLGGVSWAMLVARTCQLYPNAAAATVVHKFFLVFSQWPWPKPMLLRNNSEDTGNLGFPVWDPRVNPSDRYHIMPIITPSYPQQNSTFNVTQSTKAVMQQEFKHALEVCESIQRGKAEWKELFEPVAFFSKYRHFLVIIASSQPRWLGLVESKIRHLVAQLEHQPCIKIAHVFPQSYEKEITVRQEPNEDGTEGETKTKIQTQWFVGLDFDKQETKKEVNLTDNIQAFIDTVNATGATLEGRDDMTIEVAHVKKNKLSDYLDSEVIGKLIRPSKVVLGSENESLISVENEENNGTSHNETLESTFETTINCETNETESSGESVSTKRLREDEDVDPNKKLKGTSEVSKPSGDSTIMRPLEDVDVDVNEKLKTEVSCVANGSRTDEITSLPTTVI